jgi:hypothetical protein
LLVRKAAIHGEEGVVVGRSSREQFPVLDALPAASGYGVDLMTDEERCQIVGQILVK